MQFRLVCHSYPPGCLRLVPPPPSPLPPRLCSPPSPSPPRLCYSPSPSPPRLCSPPLSFPSSRSLPARASPSCKPSKTRGYSRILADTRGYSRILADTRGPLDSTTTTPYPHFPLHCQK
eukprot:765498-Hanusia_phi.AAC.3